MSRTAAECGCPAAAPAVLGIGTIIVLGLIGWAFGIDPRILIGGAEMMTGGGSGYEQPQQQGRQGAPQDEMGRFAAAILGNTEDVWKEVLPKQANRQYEAPKLVLFSEGTRSGCGAAQSAMGPFYCPLDQTVYIDLTFFQDMQRKFGTGGEFAYAYVLAHEVGHHVENQLGILPRVQARQREVGQSEGKPALRARRADGGLPRRRLGPSFAGEMAIAGAGRHRAGDRGGRSHRRRPPAAQDARTGRAGFLHPRLLGPARPLADHGPEAGFGAGLRHVPRQPRL